MKYEIHNDMTFLYTYQYKDHLGNIRLSYSDIDNNHAISKKTEIMEESNYYPFGLKHQGYNSTIQGRDHQFGFGNKEEQSELGIDWIDIIARNYDPALGRWMNIDPLAEFLEISSPYNYALNSPIIYVDEDGELPILINGRVAGCEDNCRGNSIYWGSQILNTIRNSGIANPFTDSVNEFHFVDGDRYLAGHPGAIMGKGHFLTGNMALQRRNAGVDAANQDWQAILSKLQRDPNSGKIIEKIQIFTHSRGAAFGEGYTDQLLELISKNADDFEDSNNVIQFVLNLAPHQSKSIATPFGVDGISLHHDDDFLSGNSMANTIAMSSDVGDGTGEAHSVDSFISEVDSFLDSFLNNEQNITQSTIDNFIKNTKENYGIDVTIKQ